MAERFIRVFSLSERLYAENSPVFIEACALTKDSQTGKLFAQIKFRNVTRKVIKAVNLHLLCKDTIGTPVGEKVPFQYLDLSVAYQQEFGGKTTIAIPEPIVRSFEILVDEVIFEDLSVVSLSEAVWEPLPKENTLISAALSPEAAEQYYYENGEKHIYLPREYKDLWQCSCGQYNKKDCLCASCQKSQDVLQDIDAEALMAAYTARKAAEKQKAEEDAKAAAEAAKKAKKNWIIAAIVGVPCLIALIIFISINGKINAVKNLEPYANLAEDERLLFDPSVEYSFKSSTIEIKGTASPWFYEDLENITVREYIDYVTRIEDITDCIEEIKPKFTQCGYPVDIVLNYYAYGDSKNPIFTVENGKLITCPIDMAKEKERLIPDLEKELNTLLDQKDYYSVRDLFSAWGPEILYDINHSAAFRTIWNYNEVMIERGFRISAANLQVCLTRLESIDENYRDVKQLKADCLEEYNGIMSISGKYVRASEYGGEEYIEFKDGCYSTCLQGGTRNILCERENGVITYYATTSELQFSGNTLTYDNEIYTK